MKNQEEKKKKKGKEKDKDKEKRKKDNYLFLCSGAFFEMMNAVVSGSLNNPPILQKFYDSGWLYVAPSK